MLHREVGERLAHPLAMVHGVLEVLGIDQELGLGRFVLGADGAGHDRVFARGGVLPEADDAAFLAVLRGGRDFEFLLAGADDPVPKRQDPQSTFEPRSGPGAGQKVLEKFAGDWDVVKTFFNSDSSLRPRSSRPMRSRTRMPSLRVK